MHVEKELEEQRRLSKRPDSDGLTSGKRVRCNTGAVRIAADGDDTDGSNAEWRAILETDRNAIDLAGCRARIGHFLNK